LDEKIDEQNPKTLSTRKSMFEWPHPFHGHRGAEDDESEYGDTTCGFKFLGWRPSWLQRFANVWSFIAAYGLAIILQGMYFTYFLAVITTIESRLEIRSQTTGEAMLHM
jgi:hypothetical protein